jgi:hypothetical protein
MHHRVAAFDSALHAVQSCLTPSRSVSTALGCRTDWTSSLGVVNGPRSCPPGLLSEVGPSPVLPWVQGRAPGDCADVRWAPVSRSPAGLPAAARECCRPSIGVCAVQPLSHARGGHLFKWVRATVCIPEGSAGRQPGRRGCHPAAPASRPRRFSRPRRCDRTWSDVPRRAPTPMGRRVSATSHRRRCPSRSAHLHGRAGVSVEPRSAGVRHPGPKARVPAPATDHGVHRVSGLPRLGPTAAWRRVPSESVHSLDALLPLGAFTPCRCSDSPALPSHRWSDSGLPSSAIAAACSTVHASARPSRRWIHALAAAASLVTTRMRRRGLSARQCPSPPLRRFRASADQSDRPRVAALPSYLLDLRVLPQVADRPASDRPSEDVRSTWLPVCSLGLCSCVAGTVRLIRRHRAGTVVALRILTRGRWSLSPGPPTLGLRRPREGAACSTWGVWLQLIGRCPQAANDADSGDSQVTGLGLPAPSCFPFGPHSGAPLGGTSAPRV